MKFNKNKLPFMNKNIKNKDLVLMLHLGIKTLYRHNKNYTKEQWFIIMDLYDLIQALEA